MRGMWLTLGLVLLAACGQVEDPVLELIAGDIGGPGNANGQGAAARFDGPRGVVVDNVGDIFIADSNNHVIRKIAPDESVTTLAGSDTDGNGASAMFALPKGLAADTTGNLYVADDTAETIRKVTTTGAVITLAGTAGTKGSANGAGTAASFDDPQGITVDRVGTLYVADTSNHTIRKISPDEVVATLVGTAGIAGSTNGTGTAAQLSGPQDVAVDDAGNLYVADTGNNAIRKVTAAGIAITLAGNPMVAGHADGVGTAAQFNGPQGVAVDGNGNVYVADTANATIRKVTPEGSTTTLAGVTGMTGIVLGTSPRFSAPRRLAIMGDSLIITDGNAVLQLRHVVQ